MDPYLIQMLIGGVAGGIAMAGRRYVPQRTRWLGVPVAALLGAIVAHYELSQLGDFPMHDFERAPVYYFGPAIVGMLGTLGTVAVVARWKEWIWFGGLAGAVVFPILRLATWLSMFLILTG